MGKEEDVLGLVLFFTTALFGTVGVVTIPMLISEFYLLHALSRKNVKVTDEAILGTFTALNALLALAFYSQDFDPSLPAVLSALTFLVLAVLIEAGVGCEVCGS